MTLEHHLPSPENPARVVVVGSRGFIGKAVIAYLQAQGIAVCPVSSSDIDLTEASSGERLEEILRPDDAVIFNSARITEMSRAGEDFAANILMARHACEAFKKIPLAQVVYISTDTVYPFGINPIVESTPAAPESLYGAMHLSRELMFRNAVESPLAILRLNAVYGAEDSHNAYGPNRFLRSALAEGKISLFGEGEETRDHTFIDDVAAVIGLCLRHRSSGCLNVASGESVSFHDIAGMIAAMFDSPVTVANMPRQRPVSHRRYDVSEFVSAFPGFRFVPLAEGLTLLHGQMTEKESTT